MAVSISVAASCAACRDSPWGNTRWTEDRYSGPAIGKGMVAVSHQNIGVLLFSEPDEVFSECSVDEYCQQGEDRSDPEVLDLNSGHPVLDRCFQDIESGDGDHPAFVVRLGCRKKDLSQTEAGCKLHLFDNSLSRFFLWAKVLGSLWPANWTDGSPVKPSV